ncbi:MAG: hypothetical protein WA194_09465 [Patescibacteria group bacterium]
MPVFSGTINRRLFSPSRNHPYERKELPFARAYVFDEPVPYRGDVRLVSLGVGKDSFAQEFPVYPFAPFGKRVRFLFEARKKRGVRQLFVSAQIACHSETEVVQVYRFFLERRVRIDPFPFVRDLRNGRAGTVTAVMQASVETPVPSGVVYRTGVSDSGRVEIEVRADGIGGFRKDAVAFLGDFERYAAKSRAFFAAVGIVDGGVVREFFPELTGQFLPSLGKLSIIRVLGRFSKRPRKPGFF